MKWKNIDAGAAYYYITSTFTNWIPLFRYETIRRTVCEEIIRALAECGGHISAYVIMPDHLHLLAYLPESGILHRFCKLWRGRSARRITTLLTEKGYESLLNTLTEHASPGAGHAVWKEQPRTLPIYSKPKLNAKVAYIHANPIRRGLVSHPQDWKHSSWRFYELNESVDLPITPVKL